MAPGADYDLWVTFQISVRLQECFEGCLVVAWSGIKLWDVWRTGRVQGRVPEVHTRLLTNCHFTLTKTVSEMSAED